MTNNLSERLKAATCGSRELDLLVLNAVTGQEWRFAAHTQLCVTRDKYEPGAVGNPICSLDRYTTSLDAALALVGEVLPDAVWTISSNEDGYAATLYELVLEDNAVRRKVVGQLSVSFASPAIALILALLTALEADDG